MRNRLLLVVLVSLGLGTAHAQPPSYTQADIGGEIAAGNPITTYSTAVKVNAQGDTVGWALINGQTRAFFYNIMNGPVLLPLTGGRPGNRALGLNGRDEDGVVLVVGSSLASSFDDPGLAVLWRVDAGRGVVMDSVEIGALPGFTAGILTAVNDRGLAVGYSSGSAGEMVMTYDAEFEVLAPLDFPARPTDVNNQDQLVGRSFRGDLSGFEDLGMPQDHSLTDLAALNDQGWTTGYAVSPNGDGAGRRIKSIVRYRADWEVLGGLSAFDGGTDINFQGDVVGRLGGPSSPALYLESASGGELLLLENLLADPADTVSEANGINDGRVIAGIGTAGAALLIPDEVPPAAPDGLTAEASSNETAIALSWTDNSDDEEGFSLERALAGSGDWSVLDTTILPEYADLTVTQGTEYDYRVRAFGPGGSSAYSNVATATAPGEPIPDTVPPEVSFSAPANDEVSGTVTVSVTADDDVGVALLQVAYSGAGGSGTVCSQTNPAVTTDCSWDVTTLDPGAYALTATATDAGGNTADAQITVTVLDVSDPLVMITSPGAGVTVSGLVTVSATASDNVGVTSLRVRYSGANSGGQVCATATGTLNCSWDVRGLDPGDYSLTATAEDAAGNTGSNQILITVEDVAPPPPSSDDGTSPSVTITEPGGGHVSGKVWVGANASDDSGITMLTIAYMRDGDSSSTVICEQRNSDTVRCKWDTRNLPEGDYTLTAKALDPFDNVGEARVSVTIAAGQGNGGGRGRGRDSNEDGTAETDQTGSSAGGTAALSWWLLLGIVALLYRRVSFARP